MTLSEIAKEYHVSAQAVRNRIQRAGYSLEDIRQPGSNQLSADGEHTIRKLFTQTPAKDSTGSAEGNQGNAQGKQGRKGSGNKLAIIQAERDELKIRTATAEALAAERQQTINILLEEIREKNATIARLSAAAAVQAAIPPPQEPAPEEHHRGGLFAWIRRRKGNTAKGE